MLISKQVVPVLASSLLLTFFSAFTYDSTPSSGRVLGLADLNFPTASGFNTLTLPAPAPFPVRSNVAAGEVEPAILAHAAFVLDRASHTVLFEKNAHESFPPASTTKIMTALITLENLALKEVLTATNPLTNSSLMGLTKGEQISVEDLLWGLLLNSGNDAALTLARAFGSESQFVELMNQKASELNLTDTHFENPTGFDHPTHLSSAYDLTILTDYALKYPFFARAVAISQKSILSASGISHNLQSTNPLLGQMAGVKGVKTGWTEGAGECLVVLMERGGHPILVTILGSSDREKDARTLIEWAYQAFGWGDG